MRPVDCSWKVILLIIFCFSAILPTQSCHVWRMGTRMKADITDHKIFPYTEVTPGTQTFQFAEGSSALSDTLKLTINSTGEKLTLEQYLKTQTKTTAFLIIRNDSILFEKYFRGYDQDDISNIFSVSKSVTSLLVGIALDEGKIDDIKDPITKYLPEFKDADPAFGRLTLEHLLDMRSGIKFNESYSSPFSEVAKLYYGTNQGKQIRKMDFEAEPGTEHNYQSVSTSLLGMVVERTTGMELGQYLEQKVWQPMGMEYRATWSVDDKKNRSTKAFCCLNTTARDLAKIGRLYLNNGNWNGTQIVSEDWVQRSRTPKLDNDCYQYQWYSTGGVAREKGEELIYLDSLKAITGAAEKGLEYYYVDEKDAGTGEWHIHYCTGNFYALGILGQYVYVNPKSNTIMIRLGEKSDKGYISIFEMLNRYLDGPPQVK